MKLSVSLNTLFTPISTNLTTFTTIITTLTVTSYKYPIIITPIAKTTMIVVYRSFRAYVDTSALTCISNGYRLCTYYVTEYMLLNKSCFQYYWDPRVSLVSCRHMTTVWSNPSLAIN